MKNLLSTVALVAITATGAFAGQPNPGSADDTWQHGYEDAAALTIELYENTAQPYAGTPSTYDNLLERFEMAWNGLEGDLNSLKIKHKELNGAFNDSQAALANKTLQVALLQSIVDEAKLVEAKVQQLYKDTVEEFAGVPSDFDNMIERFEMAWNGLLGDFNNLKIKHKELKGAHNDLQFAFDNKVLQLALIQSAFDKAKEESAHKSLVITALSTENDELKLSEANKTLQVALLQSVIADLNEELEAAQNAATGDGSLKIVSLELTIAGLEHDISELEEENAEKTIKISTLELVNTALKNQISDLEDESTAGAEQTALIIEGLLFEKESLQAEVEAAEAATAEAKALHEGHVEALTTAHNSVTAELDITVAGLEADVAKAKEIHQGHVNALITAHDGVTAELDAEVAALKAELATAWEVNAELKGELFESKANNQLLADELNTINDIAATHYEARTVAEAELEAANTTIAQVKSAFKHFTNWLKDYGRAAWVIEQSVDNISNALDN